MLLTFILASAANVHNMITKDYSTDIYCLIKYQGMYMYVCLLWELQDQFFHKKFKNHFLKELVGFHTR